MQMREGHRVLEVCHMRLVDEKKDLGIDIFCFLLSLVPAPSFSMRQFPIAVQIKLSDVPSPSTWRGQPGSCLLTCTEPFSDRVPAISRYSALGELLNSAAHLMDELA